MRLMLYPALLVKFWLVLGGFPLYERLLVVTCQFLLCCFNLGAPPCSTRRAGEDQNTSTCGTLCQPVSSAAFQCCSACACLMSLVLLALFISGL